MKYGISVFFGAASYGILSTFVVLAYDQGYSLGEVVGSQMMLGFLMTWLYASWRLRGKRARAKSSDAARLDSEQEKRSFVEKAPLNVGTASIQWKHRILLMLAGMPTAITGIFYYKSLQLLPASISILLLFQFTWIAVLFQSIRERKRPSLPIIGTLFILLAGTALASGALDQEGSPLNFAGAGLGLLAAVSYTLFILFSGRAVPSAASELRSKWMMAGAMLISFLVFPPQFLWNGELAGELFLFAAILGVFGAFIPPILFAYGVGKVGEGMAGILGAAELPVAVCLSTFVLHENVSVLQWLGVLFILAGVAMPEWIRRIAVRRNKLKTKACPEV
ncbi:DMT family transporter [Paenibacillus sp. HB172176]|uniref:EamA family transporter n=1 Tax=Paenibacillus sp. HB172176 TaxID=2493690 RepID=UPI001F1099D3|nr:DMT family transporter [Paenibacillus sp. HB172176]